MKKVFVFLILILFSTSLPSFSEGTVIRGGVALTNQVPKGFFGTWHITSVMTTTNNKNLFNETSTDYWNLSKQNDVITLSNPVSGARASISIKEVNGNKITFARTSTGKNERVTESPTLTLDGENFYGTDKIVIEKYKFGELVSTDIVEYKIKAEKVSGNSASEIFP